jgi:hypothetical protein
VVRVGKAGQQQVAGEQIEEWRRMSDEADILKQSDGRREAKTSKCEQTSALTLQQNWDNRLIQVRTHR